MGTLSKSLKQVCFRKIKGHPRIVTHAGRVINYHEQFSTETKEIDVEKGRKLQYIRKSALTISFGAFDIVSSPMRSMGT